MVVPIWRQLEILYLASLFLVVGAFRVLHQNSWREQAFKPPTIEVSTSKSEASKVDRCLASNSSSAMYGHKGAWSGGLSSNGQEHVAPSCAPGNRSSSVTRHEMPKSVKTSIRPQRRLQSVKVQRFKGSGPTSLPGSVGILAFWHADLLFLGVRQFQSVEASDCGWH